MKNEVEALHAIDHPNVLRLDNQSAESTYYSKSGKPGYKVMYIVMEACQNGNLFDVIYRTGPFDERLARTFFR